MTKDKAIARATKMARLADDTRFVVYDCREYYPASEEDIDTFYAGASVVVEVEADGSQRHFF